MLLVEVARLSEMCWFSFKRTSYRKPDIRSWTNHPLSWDSRTVPAADRRVTIVHAVSWPLDRDLAAGDDRPPFHGTPLPARSRPAHLCRGGADDRCRHAPAGLVRGRHRAPPRRRA